MRKLFGDFSEPVCSSYVHQVLFGLEYLHAQGVLHRDIKGANILTSKTGVAKVADFGVAARAASFAGADLDDDMVGSPYWMAPEIIEMSAPPSAACDIWSLGCTILELTTGKPPHFDLTPMAALFRIVQDDVPRLPAGASEALRDFLLQCFNREAALRANARVLLGHAWLQRAPPQSVSISEVGGFAETPSCAQALAPMIAQQQSHHFSSPNGKDELQLTSRASGSKSISTEHANSSGVVAPSLIPAVADSQMLRQYREDEEDQIEDGFDVCKIVDDFGSLSCPNDPVKNGWQGARAEVLPLSNSFSSEANWDINQHDAGSRRGSSRIKFEASIDTKADVLDPFTVGFFEDAKDFVHDDLRDRNIKKQEEINDLLFDFAVSVKKGGKLLLRLFKLLKPIVDEEHILSELGAISLVEAFRSQGCVIEVLQALRTILFAVPNAADLLSALGIAPVLTSLIPITKLDHRVLGLLGAVLNMFGLRCSGPRLRVFLFSGGLQLAVELLMTPDKTARSRSQCIAILASVEFLIRALDVKTVKLQLQSPSRAALCRALALRDTPAKLAASLEASLRADPSPDRYSAELMANALAALCDADTVVKESIAASRTATIVLDILAEFPQRVRDAWEQGIDGDADAKLTVRLLKTLKAISMTSAEALDSLASCGAIETVVAVLEVTQVGAVRGDGFTKRLVPRRDELEDQLVPIVYYLCRIDRSRLARAARCGAATLLAACVARRRHLKQFALAVLCELCHVAASDNQGDVAAELWRAGGVRLYVRLLDETYWCVRALAALSSWLKADIRVESAMSEPYCAKSIVFLFQRLDRAEFEQTLEPLLDACNTSPRFVRALLDVSADLKGYLFVLEIGHKLEGYTSAITRKTLLEILRATLATMNNPRSFVLETNIDNVLISLLTDDSISGQVLVMNLAGNILLK